MSELPAPRPWPGHGSRNQDVSLQPSGVKWLRLRALESDGLGSTPSSAIFELCPLGQIPKLLCASFPPLCGLAVRIKSENSSKVFSKGWGCESPELLSAISLSCAGRLVEGTCHALGPPLACQSNGQNHNALPLSPCL